jgi:hypothetical protein
MVEMSAKKIMYARKEMTVGSRIDLVKCEIIGMRATAKKVAKKFCPVLAS